MLIVLSPDFLNSHECEFQTKFAATLGIEQRCRKLIPIIYKPCDLPAIIRMLTKIDFSNRSKSPHWTWNRLINSICDDKRRTLFSTKPQNALTYPDFSPIVTEVDDSQSAMSLPSLPEVPSAPLLTSSSVASNALMASNTISTPSPSDSDKMSKFSLSACRNLHFILDGKNLFF